MKLRSTQSTFIRPLQNLLALYKVSKTKYKSFVI